VNITVGVQNAGAAVLTTVEGANGQSYYFGDAINARTATSCSVTRQKPSAEMTVVCRATQRERHPKPQ
jgi:hypothetical protein